MTDTAITITIDVPDSTCAAIICTAFESGQYGIGYWACAEDVQHGSEDPLDDLYYKSITLVDAEEAEDWKHVVDYAAIRRGLQAVLSPGFKVNPTMRGYVQSGVVGDNLGDIDGDAADVIVQAACFGEIVYG